MEAELQRFRQKKLAEERKGKIKENLKKTWDNVTSKLASAVLPQAEENSDDDDGEETEQESSRVQGQRTEKRGRLKRNSEETDVISRDDTTKDDDDDSKRSRTLTITIVALKFIMWAFLWTGFIKIGFGAVFFAVSTFYFMWVNMNSGKRRRRGQKSAYSVFNENCEAIDGTLNAEMLEKNLLYRAPLNSD